MRLDAITSIYVKAVNLTFGGGDPTIAVLQRELCEQRKYLTLEQHALVYSLARLTPGTNLLAYVAGTAWLLGGVAGSVAAVVAGTVPSTVLSVWLTIGLEWAESNVTARHAVGGLMAAVIGMMAAAVLLLLKPFARHSLWIRALLIAGGSFVLRHWGDLSPLSIIGIAALIGFVWQEEPASK